jgi:hypothetical protein
MQIQSFTTPENFSLYKSSYFDQLFYLLKRSVLCYVKNYNLFLIDLFMSVITAVLGGIIYFKNGTIADDGTCQFSQESLANVTFAIFYTIFVTVIYSILTAVLVSPFIASNKQKIFYKTKTKNF